MCVCTRAHGLPLTSLCWCLLVCCCGEAGPRVCEQFLRGLQIQVCPLTGSDLPGDGALVPARSVARAAVPGTGQAADRVCGGSEGVAAGVGLCPGLAAPVRGTVMVGHCGHLAGWAPSGHWLGFQLGPEASGAPWPSSSPETDAAEAGLGNGLDPRVCQRSLGDQSMG